ncbi:Haloalkane dehalogenase [Pelagimonas phthalicica]|uniref:Haloalkane dehalogenase n=1 Tax=Pelagimonas phthalicica TaxID=1037362 RepID=A0A238JH61_9RHOB|nr:alpha/beta hydrolase [Pelagimonas phthalicica]TDS92416.1 pimeloyl-ACP methyl ester carboxylesterase [Pelagimonas phthalicica]SMX29477.1 Haloalkane dehalogenase [Pelagimonas phthalicica]
MTPSLFTSGALLFFSSALPVLAAGATDHQVTYNTVEIGEVSLFYREAGPKSAPTLLLLHGFPSSSHMFRNLIPELAETYHVIAPDYPGFGQSSAPDAEGYDYDFATLAATIIEFTETLELSNYTLFMQDFGGPVGFRMALANPDRVDGIIIQNATIHAQGWNPDIVSQFAPFWGNRTVETEAPLRGFFAPETTRWQYTQGATLAERINPDAWVHDQAGLDRPGNHDIQLEYLWNYQDNVAQYPEWQSYLAEHQPDTLIVWGRNDPFFLTDGVSAIQELVPAADVHLFDAGHFALETHVAEISAAIHDFMSR